MAAAVALLEQSHESIFETRCGRSFRGGALMAFAAYHAHAAAFRYRIDNGGLVEQPRLEITRGFSARRGDAKDTALGEGAYGCGAALGQDLALAQHDGFVAMLGFVEVRCAEQHGEMLLVDEMADDLPQFAARQRIDADRRLVEQQQRRRADQRAGEAEFLLHAAG
jgi:hypothetical protein